MIIFFNKLLLIQLINIETPYDQRYHWQDIYWCLSDGPEGDFTKGKPYTLK